VIKTQMQRAVVAFFFLTLTTLLTVPLATAAEAPASGESPDTATYANLADILQDEQAREQLILDLRALAAGETPAAAVDVPQSSAERISLARQIADSTRELAEDFVSQFFAAIEAVTAMVSGSAEMDVGELLGTTTNLLIVMAVTIGLFLVLRLVSRPVFSAINRWAMTEGGRSAMLRKSVAVTGSALLDVLGITLAFVVGYVVALFVLGSAGEMDIHQSLFLNAFLLIEIFKAIIRGLFAARDDGLRMMPLSAEQAAYWNAWLARLSGFIGYGILFLVPLASAILSPAVGRLVAFVVMLLAFLYALAIILQNKTSVTQGLLLRAGRTDLAFNRVLLTMLAKCWYVVAIVYFAALALVTVARPEDALPFMLGASLQSVVAIGVGLFVSVVLSQLISRGFHLPEETQTRFPMLEARLNSFLPNIMKAVRLAILIVIAGFVADAWGLFDLMAWFASESGSRTLGTVVSVAIIIILAMAVWIGLASWIEQRLNPASGTHEASARERTLLTIFRNAVAITIIVMTAMIVLSEIGINIGPLIAGAGVLGLAIGFGAQKLVQDIITGVFIQLENAINAGDVVTAAGVTGVAEKLTIRSLGIRDLSGTYHLIPFSSVDTVANYMREFAYHVGEYGVAYREDIDDVILRLREAFAELIADPEHKANILAELEVHGVTALADSSVNIRVRIKTVPGTQWGVGRAYNRLVKYHLDAAGIEIPFPHMTLYFGEDKEGKAPPAPIMIQSGRPEDSQASVPGIKDRHAKTNAKEGEDYDEPD